MAETIEPERNAHNKHERGMTKKPKNPRNESKEVHLHSRHGEGLAADDDPSLYIPRCQALSTSRGWRLGKLVAPVQIGCPIDALVEEPVTRVRCEVPTAASEAVPRRQILVCRDVFRHPPEVAHGIQNQRIRTVHNLCLDSSIR